MSDPIHVLHVIARLNVGGPAIHVALLTHKLRARGYDAQIICGSVGAEEGDMTYYARDLGIEPIQLPELGRELSPLRDLVTLWKLYRLIRRLRPQIVHTHTAKAGFVGRIAAWLAGVPVIVHTFHGHVFHGYFSRRMTRVFIWLERLTARMSDTVITLTEGLRAELADEYRIARRAKITVLPLGLDLSAFADKATERGGFRASIGVSPDAPLVGIVGRLVPVKNHALFLRAIVLLYHQYPHVRFVIVGDGELRSTLERQIADADIGDRVQITGWIKDMAHVYADLDVLVISSINEGMPTTIIEALAAGVPVVATAVGGVPDLLDGGALGRLVPSGDPSSLALAIVEVLRDPPDGERASAVMIDRYGIDGLVRDLDDLYRALLARRRRPRA